MKHNRSGFVFGYDREIAEQRHTNLQKRIRKGQLTRVVVTSAQNTTRKANKFFKSLLKYCQINGAELIVIPVHYKNISLYETGRTYVKKWDKDLEPYLVDRPLRIGRITIHAEIKIQATSLNPLRGKDSISGPQWTVFGHPQLSRETVCDVRRPKLMFTTGSVTIKNYSQTDLGARAEFHHVQGALVIETTGSKTWVRQLNGSSSTGHFYDLDCKYTPTRVVRSQRVLALVTGDTHVRNHSPAVRKGTFDGPNSIVGFLKPHYIVRHDVLDSYFCSHHHEKNDILKYRKHWQRQNSGRQELEEAIQFLNETTPKNSTNLIVASNHHDHLYRWLERVDPKFDPENAELIYELKLLQLTHALRTKKYDPYDTDPFRLYAEPRLKCRTKFLRRREPFYLKGVDVSNHGDIGPNGSRGSAKALARSTHKMFTGHGHYGLIYRGVYQVGKSSNDEEYILGLSNHTRTHGIIYPDGKRTLIDFIGSRWRR